MLPLLLLLLSLGVQSSPRAALFQRGEWKTVVQIVSLDAPNLSEATRRDLRRSMEQLGNRQCRGGATPDPLRDIQDGIVRAFSAGGNGGSCSFDDDEIANGRFSTRAVCRIPGQPVEATSVLRGTYNETSLAADLTTSVVPSAAPDGPPLFRFQATLTSSRIGPC